MNYTANGKPLQTLTETWHSRGIFGAATTTWIVLRPPQARKALPNRSKAELSRLKSQYGDAIPRVWGMMRLSGQVIWSSDLVEHVREVEGTAGTGTTETTGTEASPYYYTGSLAIAICANQIEDITRIWADGVLIYDRSLSTPSRYTIRIHLGSEGQNPDPVMVAALGEGNVPAYRGVAYISIDDMDLTPWDGRYPEEISFKVIQSSEALVSDVFEDLFQLCGLTPTDYDVSDIGYGLNGYILDDKMTGRDGLEHLCKLWGIDLVEIDGKIVAVVRGCSPAVTVDEEDLAARMDGGGDPPPKVSTVRVSEVELPSNLSLTYLDSARQYQPNTQRAHRYARALTDDRVEISAPVVLTANGARQAAERMLYTEWLERTQFSFSLPPKYLEIAPSSPVNLPVAGEMVRVRVVGMDIGLFGALNISAVLDADYVLEQEAEGDEAATTETTDGGTDPTAVTTLFTLWSVPELRDQDGTAAGFYVAANSESAAWTGAAIHWAPAATGPYAYAGQANTRASFGAATSTLPDGAVAEAWDETNEVDVTLEGIASLTSVLPSAVEAGQNRALLGSEVLGFANATLGDPDEYTLDTLKRGLRGTSMTGHTSEDLFVRYTPASVVRVSVPSSLIGSLVYVKLITPGQTLEDVAWKTVLIGVPSLPYPVSGAWSYDFSQPQNSGYLPV